MRRSNDGFALIIVLFYLFFLSLIVERSLGEAKTAIFIASFENHRAQNDADIYAALQTTIFYLINRRGDSWPLDGTHHLSLTDGSQISVETRLLHNRIPINYTDLYTLTALLASCKSDQTSSLKIARNILYSSKNKNNFPQKYNRTRYYDTQEIYNAPGMTPYLARCISNHISIYQQEMPDIYSTDSTVVDSIKISKHYNKISLQNNNILDPLTPTSRTIVKIDLTLIKSSIYRRTTIISIIGDPLDAVPYRLLAWRNSDAPELR